MIDIWKVECDITLPEIILLKAVDEHQHRGRRDIYYNKLDALEHNRRDLMLMAEEIEDKLLEVRQEIHRLKGER